MKDSGSGWPVLAARLQSLALMAIACLCFALLGEKCLRLLGDAFAASFFACFVRDDSPARAALRFGAGRFRDVPAMMM